MGKTVTSASGPCLHCVCQEDGFMHCDPQRCKPEAPLMLKMNSNFFRRRQWSTPFILTIFQFTFRLNEGVKIVVGIKQRKKATCGILCFLLQFLHYSRCLNSIQCNDLRLYQSLFLCVYLCNYLFFYQTPIAVVNLKKKNECSVCYDNELFCVNSISAVHSG